MRLMAFRSTELEAGMHGFEGFDAIGFGHHAAGADFAGSNQFDVYVSLGKEAEHSASCSCGGGHPSTDRADAGNCRPIFENGPWPLG